MVDAPAAMRDCPRESAETWECCAVGESAEEPSLRWLQGILRIRLHDSNVGRSNKHGTLQRKDPTNWQDESKRSLESGREKRVGDY